MKSTEREAHGKETKCEVSLDPEKLWGYFNHESYTALQQDICCRDVACLSGIDGARERQEAAAGRCFRDQWLGLTEPSLEVILSNKRQAGPGAGRQP